MRRGLILAATGTLLASAMGGCSEISDRITPVDAHIWRPGVTTEAQIVDALGPPADRNFLPEGQILERWRGYVGVRGRERLAYGFVFDPRGLLVRNANSGEMHAPGL